MSFLSRVWTAIRKPLRYVGRDLEGNRFYEAHSPNDPSRMKRTVQYYDPENMWRYIGGGKQLPIQWSAWLTHTRRHPPTLEELEADYVRRERVLANVAKIEARDRAEAEEMRRIRHQDAHLAIEEAATRGERLLPKTETTVEDEGFRPQPNFSDATVSSQSPTLEPQTTPAVSATMKVRPPTFLTPTAPRKPKSSKPFSLPILDSGKVDQPEQPESIQEKVANAVGSNVPSQEPNARQKEDPFPWKKTSETESWMPKARTRG